MKALAEWRARRRDVLPREWKSGAPILYRGRELALEVFPRAARAGSRRPLPPDRAASARAGRGAGRGSSSARGCATRRCDARGAAGRRTTRRALAARRAAGAAVERAQRMGQLQRARRDPPQLAPRPAAARARRLRRRARGRAPGRAQPLAAASGRSSSRCCRATRRCGASSRTGRRSWPRDETAGAREPVVSPRTAVAGTLGRPGGPRRRRQRAAPIARPLRGRSRSVACRRLPAPRSVAADDFATAASSARRRRGRPARAAAASSAAPSSSPLRVSRQRRRPRRKWNPPVRAATQISRLGTWRFTISLLPSSQSISRMPSFRLQSTSASLSASAASSAAPMRGSVASAAAMNSSRSWGSRSAARDRIAPMLRHPRPLAARP